MYFVWNARNQAIFDGEVASVDEIVRRIQIVVMRYATLEASHVGAP